jgi:hypothetical protein
MTRTTLAIAMLLVATGFTLGIPTADAGGGMGAGSGVTTCRFVASGAPNQPQSIAVVDPFVTVNELPNPNTPGDVVKVNAAVLVCELLATAKTVSGPATGGPIIETEATSTTCYAVSGSNPAKFNVTVKDPFTEVGAPSGVQSMVLGGIQLVCVPSITAPVQ